MESFMAIGLGEENIPKIGAITRSYPEGINVAEIMKNFDFSNSNNIRAALKVLEDRGDVVREGERYYAAIYRSK